MEIDAARRVSSNNRARNIERFLPIRAQQGRRRGNDAGKTLNYTADRKDVASAKLQKIEQMRFLFFRKLQYVRLTARFAHVFIRDHDTVIISCAEGKIVSHHA